MCWNPDRMERGLLNTFHQFKVGDSWSTWHWFWSVWPPPGGDPNLLCCYGVGERRRGGTGIFWGKEVDEGWGQNQDRRVLILTPLIQRRKVEVGMWMGQGSHTAEPGVSTGIYGGIRGLISEGTELTRLRLRKERLNMKRKSKDWLCLLSLNGNNISDVEVTVTHWFYMLGILASSSRLKK